MYYDLSQATHPDIPSREKAEQFISLLKTSLVSDEGIKITVLDDMVGPTGINVISGARRVLIAKSRIIEVDWKNDKLSHEARKIAKLLREDGHLVAVAFYELRFNDAIDPTSATSFFHTIIRYAAARVHCD